MTIRVELPWMESLRRRAEWYRAVRRACRCAKDLNTGRTIRLCRCGAVDVLRPTYPWAVHTA
jgi:hypothetical protein